MHRALTETRPAPRPAPGAAVPQQRLKQRSMRSAQLGKRRPTQGSAGAPAGRAGRRPSYSQRASGFRWEEGKFTEHQYQELEWGITERESVSLQLRLKLSFSAQATEPWQAVFTQPLAHSVTAQRAPPGSEESLTACSLLREGCHTTHLPADSQLCLSSWALFLYIKQENSSEHSSSSHLLPLSDQSFRNLVRLNYSGILLKCRLLGLRTVEILGF